ncbi:MAG: sulfotransferase family protein, partial [Vicinamibacteraceae bacterium]
MSTAPIFIVGLNRSGTTLLRLMLDAHSRIAIPNESHFFLRYYKRRAELADLREPHRRVALVEQILREPYVQRWDRKLAPSDIDLGQCTSLEETIRQIYLAYARLFGKDLWGDKTPEYSTEAHVLNRMFPDARFIHLIRDGRDVALSIIQRKWGPDDFVTAMRAWAQDVTWTRKMLGMLPEDRYVELRFEDLIARPEAELRRVTEFLGVGFEEQMLRYSEGAEETVGGNIHTRIHGHLSKPPLATQGLKWMRTLSAADQAVAHELAGPVLAELGYPPGVTEHPFRVLRKGYHRIREAVTWRRKRHAGPRTRNAPSG